MSESGPSLPETPPTLELPQEIIDLVIDQFDDEDEGTLARLLAPVSLISRAWYSRTRERIFESITIDQDDFESVDQCIHKIGDLCDLFKANPDLPPLIKSFSLCDMTAELFECSQVDDRGDATYFIAQALSQLTCLREFCFYAVGSPEIPRQVYEAISSVVYGPELEYLFLGGMRGIDIVSVVQHSNIKALFLRFCLPHPTPGDGNGFLARLGENPLPRPTKVLKRLEVARCGKALKTLLENSPEPGLGGRIHLEYLSVATSDWDADMEDAFSLLVASRHLETVTEYAIVQDCFQARGDPLYTTFPPIAFDFSPFPNLRVLTFKTVPPHFFHLDLDQGVVDSLVQGLESLSHRSGGSKLRCLNLRFNYDVDEEEEGEYDFQTSLAEVVEGEIWSKIDTILTRPGFSQIRRVTVTFNFTAGKMSDEDWTSVKAKVVGKMERLNRRKKIVTVERTEEN